MKTRSAPPQRLIQLVNDLLDISRLEAAG